MDGQNTTSTLKIAPTAKDHDADIICSAVNPLLLANSNNSSLGPASAGIETRRKLIVHCKFFLWIIIYWYAKGALQGENLCNLSSLLFFISMFFRQ